MGQFSHTTSLAHDNSANDTRLSEFMTEVREFGRAEASGKDALPMLAVAVVRAVCDGVLDTGKDASGDDAATRVFNEYAKARGRKQIHERTEGGLKANISKLRQIVTFAGNPKYDAVDVLNRAIIMRNKLLDDEIDVKPAYAAYVDLARAQIKEDDALSDDMIEAVIRKGPGRDKTLEGELEKIAKSLEKIVTGENAHGIQDQSPEIVKAHELIGARLAALLHRAKTLKALEDAVATGILTQEEADERVDAVTKVKLDGGEG